MLHFNEQRNCLTDEDIHILSLCLSLLHTAGSKLDLAALHLSYTNTHMRTCAHAYTHTHTASATAQLSSLNRRCPCCAHVTPAHMLRPRFSLHLQKETPQLFLHIQDISLPDKKCNCASIPVSIATASHHSN